MQMIHEVYEKQAAKDGRKEQVERIDYASCHVETALNREESNTTLNVFVVLKVRRHIPQSYTYELRSVLALFRKSLSSSVEELNFYSIENELPANDQQRSTIKKAFSTSTQANTVVCLLVDWEDNGHFIEIRPDYGPQVINQRQVGHKVLGAYFGPDELQVFIANDILTLAGVSSNDFTILQNYHSKAEAIGVKTQPQLTTIQR